MQKENNANAGFSQSAAESSHSLVPGRCSGRRDRTQFPVQQAVAGILARQLVMVKIVFDRHALLSYPERRPNFNQVNAASGAEKVARQRAVAAGGGP